MLPLDFSDAYGFVTLQLLQIEQASMIMMYCGNDAWLIQKIWEKVKGEVGFGTACND